MCCIELSGSVLPVINCAHRTEHSPSSVRPPFRSRCLAIESRFHHLQRVLPCAKTSQQEGLKASLISIEQHQSESLQISMLSHQA